MWMIRCDHYRFSPRVYLIGIHVGGRYANWYFCVAPSAERPEPTLTPLDCKIGSEILLSSSFSSVNVAAQRRICCPLCCVCSISFSMNMAARNAKEIQYLNRRVRNPGSYSFYLQFVVPLKSQVLKFLALIVKRFVVEFVV